MSYSWGQNERTSIYGRDPDMLLQIHTVRCENVFHTDCPSSSVSFSGIVPGEKLSNYRKPFALTACQDITHRFTASGTDRDIRYYVLFVSLFLFGGGVRVLSVCLSVCPPMTLTMAVVLDISYAQMLSLVLMFLWWMSFRRTFRWNLDFLTWWRPWSCDPLWQKQKTFFCLDYVRKCDFIAVLTLLFSCL